MNNNQQKQGDSEVQHDLETGRIDSQIDENKEKVGLIKNDKTGMRSEGEDKENEEEVEKTLSEFDDVGEMVEEVVSENIINPEELYKREQDWEKRFSRDFRYFQELRANPEFRSMFMSMTTDDYERLVNDFSLYLESNDYITVKKIFTQPDHFLHILDREQYNARLYDLKEYVATNERKPEYQKKLAKLMRDWPEFFEPSLSGLPKGETKESIEAKLRLYFFTDNEITRITNFIGDFRNFKQEKMKASTGAEAVLGMVEKDEVVETEDEVLQQVKDKFGHTIFIGDEFVNLSRVDELESPGIKKQLEELNRVPESLAKYLVKEHLVIRISDTYIGEMVEGSEELEKEGLESSVMGFYLIPENQIYVAASTMVENQEATSSVILHEYGHAVDFLLEQIPMDEKLAAYDKFYDRLTFYVRSYRVENKEELGARELFADSFADYFKFSKQEFIAKYDEEWYNRFNKIIHTDYSDYENPVK